MISIRYNPRYKGLFSEEELRRVLLKAMEVEGVRGEVSVLICGDRMIRRLNREYRGVDRVTDVLAFPLRDEFPGTKDFLGEIIISLPRARRQAEGTLEDELRILIVHGFLHLIGYEDGTEEGRREMMERTLYILKLVDRGDRGRKYPL